MAQQTKSNVIVDMVCLDCEEALSPDYSKESEERVASYTDGSLRGTLYRCPFCSIEIVIRGVELQIVDDPKQITQGEQK